jgi:hypothetical protein
MSHGRHAGVIFIVNGYRYTKFSCKEFVHRFVKALNDFHTNRFLKTGKGYH